MSKILSAAEVAELKRAARVTWNQERYMPLCESHEALRAKCERLTETLSALVLPQGTEESDIVGFCKSTCVQRIGNCAYCNEHWYDGHRADCPVRKGQALLSGEERKT